MLNAILEFLRKVWNAVKKFFVRLFDYVNHILGFFTAPERKDLFRDPDNLAVVVRRKLDGGKYQMIDCGFSKSRCTVVDVQDVQVITADKLDAKTTELFGEMDMLVVSH